MLQKNYKINDYISNDAKLTATILKSTKNIYLAKSDTGMGGSSVFLNAKNQKIILLQPLTGMIESKAKDYSDNKDIYFIYGGSKNKIQQSIDRIQSIGSGVICTTAESLLSYTKLNGTNFIKQYTLVVDEIDAYTTTEYRSEAFFKLYQLIEQRNFKRFIATTATPTEDYMDVPIGIIDEVINVSRVNERIKQITINKTLHIGQIANQIANGDKVVIFTNSSSTYNTFLNSELFANNKIQCLVGNNINPKINPKTQRTNEEFIFDELQQDADIYMLSTKYLIGYDLPIDAHVYIISDTQKGARTNEIKNHNEIIQAHGRVRHNVLSATLILNGESPSYNYTNIIKLYEKTKDLKDFQLFMGELSNKLICDTFDTDILINKLTQRGFVVTISDEFNTQINTNKYTLKEKMNNLIIEDIVTLRKHLDVILLNLAGDLQVDSSLSIELALEYACAIALKESNNYECLNKSSVRMDRLINHCVTLLDIATLQHPEKETITIGQYIYNADTNIKEDSKANIVLLYDIAGKILDKAFIRLIKSAETDKKRVEVPNSEGYTAFAHEIIFNNKKYKINQYKNIDHDFIFKKIKRDVVNALLKSKATQDQINKVLDKCVSIITELKTIKNFKNKANLLATYNSIRIDFKSVKKRYINYLKYLLVKKTSNNPINFKITKVDSREYNPITKVNKQLRHLISQSHQMLDIVAANPTFVDYLVGSELGNEVYINIMNNKQMTRNDAKKHYNTILNIVNKDEEFYKTFAIDCGYNEQQATRLANRLFNNKKGEMFQIMTKIEKSAIALIINELELPEGTYTRLHDAIMIHNTDQYDINKTFTDCYLNINVNKEF